MALKQPEGCSRFTPHHFWGHIPKKAIMWSDPTQMLPPGHTTLLGIQMMTTTPHIRPWKCQKNGVATIWAFALFERFFWSLLISSFLWPQIFYSHLMHTFPIWHMTTHPLLIWTETHTNSHFWKGPLYFTSAIVEMNALSNSICSRNGYMVWWLDVCFRHALHWYTPFIDEFCTWASPVLDIMANSSK